MFLEKSPSPFLYHVKPLLYIADLFLSPLPSFGHAKHLKVQSPTSEKKNNSTNIYGLIP